MTVSFNSTNDEASAGLARRDLRRYGVDLREHKFFPPAARRGAIVRHALLERVTRLGVPRAVILQAPLGSGKSTLLQQITDACRAKQWTMGWLTLDETDNDPRRFEAYFIALVAHMVAQAGVAAHEQPRLSTDNVLDWVCDQIGRISGPIGLCIDDFQCIHEPAILRFFRDLVRVLPGRCRMFVGSRNLPDIGVSALLVAEHALLLRMDELRFSSDESVEYLSGTGNEALDPESASFVHARTEGWPAGLQLFRLALAREDIRRTLDKLRDREPLEIVHYLSENVLSLQRPDVQTFLLKTSLLRRLNGPLCEAVTGLRDPDAILRQIEQGGLFLEALDGSPGWYRYHSLFARFLSARLGHEDPDGVLDVHRRAAHWYARHDEPEETLFHAVEAREYSLAIDTLDQWAARLIAGAELATVASWFDRLPLQDVIDHPGLAVKVAWALVFLRRGIPKHPLLSHLEGAAMRGGGRAASGAAIVLAMAKLFNNDLRGAALLADVPALHRPARDIFEAFEFGAAANLLAFRAMAAWREEEIHPLLVLADSHNDHAQAAFSQGYTLALRCVQQVIGAQPSRAAETPRALPGARPRVIRGMAAAAVAATRIWACYEADDLDTAERLAAQFEQDIALASVPEFNAISMVSIARVHLARGRIADAQDTLDALERLSFQSQWPGVREMIAWERLYLAGRRGEPARIDALVSHMAVDASVPDTAWIPVTEMLSGPLLGHIRLALQQQQLERAADLVESALAIVPVRPLLSVKLQVLQALVQHRQGQTRLALRTLQRVCEAVRAGGCRRALLDEGAELIAMLDDVQATEAARGAAAPAPVSGVQKAGRFGTLSQREHEILRLLCSGASNREISEKLFLSENTVKFHLKNVYLKLEVKNRAQAILKAQSEMP
ncbi:LuxR C-terminal-related transcriptional regulator [Burkholderia multivorans]|uniref:LuxR C-terminal-related transcriptional regulator n=1 Tax=Burkholderia multivorans TaxID=87883 RepID=UPI000CFFA211|nr:LuxR C-terminal-related transcriptional regulator [Burkholderia multivorans]MBY4791630.1 LuxR C-terminal-related transcriptional regulator [Burkholderia multivorans]PRE59498.1 LuxR family transcriptional regulator [Burkholderia multivorans]PRE77057.1 LuxR family transcriptional regulator [Burkholderia multivorans]PRG17273.1 LuxR family transcriptional regulator [Burkholderia multivorans]